MALVGLCLALPAPSTAQVPPQGEVTGVIVDQVTRAPIEGATVFLHERGDSTRVRSTYTAKDGRFALAGVPPGGYFVECGSIGYGGLRLPDFVLSPGVPRMDLGTIALKLMPVMLKPIEVKSRRVLDTADDRRVYNVTHDLMANSSSASDLLQNIPSVDVDINGNVSLRGSSDVLILVNGKKTPLMGRNRADVLQQLPASSIDKIEVATNPSAKYSSEGTAGIINIVMKKGAQPGTLGSVGANLSPSGPHNESLSFSRHPGGYDVFANYSHRDDDRTRAYTDGRDMPLFFSRTQRYEKDGFLTSQGGAHVANLGWTLHPQSKNMFELSADYFSRDPDRGGAGTFATWGAGDVPLSERDRVLRGSDHEEQVGLSASYQHDFAAADHNLRVQASAFSSPQTSDTHNSEVWQSPIRPDRATDTALRRDERQGSFSIDYSDPIGASTKLEAGYLLETQRQHIQSNGDSLDFVDQEFLASVRGTYDFQYDQRVQALYATWGHSFGGLSALAGLRGEQAIVSPDLVSAEQSATHRYSMLLPSMHLTFHAGPHQDFHANYTSRVRRPQAAELNPFPIFTDSYTLRAGSLDLRPELIRSLELGYRLRRDHFSFLPTLYYRTTRDGFATSAGMVNSTTILQTMENIANRRSVGFEPVVKCWLGPRVEANISGNVCHEHIDVANDVDAGPRTGVSWIAKVNLNVDVTRTTRFQVSSHHASSEITAEGSARAHSVLNLGARQELWHARVSLTCTLADALKSLEQANEVDVLNTQQLLTSRSNGRRFFAGATYHFGGPDHSDKSKLPEPTEDDP